MAEQTKDSMGKYWSLISSKTTERTIWKQNISRMFLHKMNAFLCWSEIQDSFTQDTMGKIDKKKFDQKLQSWLNPNCKWLAIS